MRTPTVVSLLLVAAVFSFGSPTVAQDADSRRDLKFIDDWKSGRAPAKPRSKRKGAAPRAGKPMALALGFTVYKRDVDGNPVQVDPSQPLRDGDAIRLVFETNSDGYLYVFNLDDRDNQPVMIFPDPRLRAGANRVSAHVAYEVPSRANPNPKFRWLFIDKGPLTDRLVFVLAREPLKDVPVGRALTSHDWIPSDAVWTPITGGLVATTQEVRRVTPGTRQTRSEDSSIRRSIRLRPDDPGPAIVRATSAPNAVQLVTSVDLVH